MSRTIKAKSTKQYSPYLVWSKGQHIALQKENKKREFLNCFVDSKEDLDYDFDFIQNVDTKVFWWSTGDFENIIGIVKNGKYRERQPKFESYPLHEEIEADFFESVNNENEDSFHVGTYDYDFDKEITSYIGRNQTSEEVSYYVRFRYLPESVFQYYFGKNIAMEDVPNWAIVARLWGITPNLISEKAGISKKLAREIYSQFDFDWTECFPTSLISRYTEFKERLPEYFRDLEALMPFAMYENLKDIYKNNPDSFTKREIIREDGREYEMDRNIERITFVLTQKRNCFIPMNFPTFNNIEKAVQFFESFMADDVEISDNPPLLSEGFISCTSNPRKIFHIGNKFRNCLRYRCLNWEENDGYVLEHENGFVLEVVNQHGRWCEIEAKRRFNVSLTNADYLEISKFNSLNNKKITE